MVAMVRALGQAAHLREAAWWKAAGPSERPQGWERPSHASEGLGGSHDSLKRLRGFGTI